MKSLLIAAICLAQVWILNASSAKSYQNWHSFKADVLSVDYSLVDFFASWCPHCNKFGPIFDKAAELIKEGSLKERVELAKIKCDSDEGEKVCQSNGITGYPTLKVYHKGMFMEDYKGNRTVDDIVKYMKEIAETGKPQFLGKHIEPQRDICLAKDYKHYVTHKS